MKKSTIGLNTKYVTFDFNDAVNERNVSKVLEKMKKLMDWSEKQLSASGVCHINFRHTKDEDMHLISFSDMDSVFMRVCGDIEFMLGLFKQELDANKNSNDNRFTDLRKDYEFLLAVKKAMNEEDEYLCPHCGKDINDINVKKSKLTEETL
jgi:uncharacterized membrane protein YvbJ